MAGRSPGALVALATTVLTGCGGTGPDDAGLPADVPILRPASTPTLQIGVVEGPDEYTFGALASAVRLPDGGVAVSDASTNRVSVYEPDGSFRHAFGGEGEGPGEFRGLSRLFVRGDSLLAFDGRTGRLSVFDADGTYARQFPAVELSADSTFTLDVFLYGRFWVDGALDPGARAAVRATLDRLAPPRSGPGWRYVRVARDGRLWIREPGDTDRHRWTVVDPTGRPVAVAELPARFDPWRIGSDDALGRWRDETDVDFVRALDLAPAGETTAPPSWMHGGDPAGSVEPPPDAEAFREEIRTTVMALARAQEIHYSTAFTYTADLEALEEFEGPAEVTVDFVDAGPRGWTAVFAHPRLGYVCGLGYGFTLPPGWVPGMIVCADEPGAGAAAGGP